MPSRELVGCLQAGGRPLSAAIEHRRRCWPHRRCLSGTPSRIIVAGAAIHICHVAVSMRWPEPDQSPCTRTLCTIPDALLSSLRAHILARGGGCEAQGQEAGVSQDLRLAAGRLCAREFRGQCHFGWEFRSVLTRLLRLTLLANALCIPRSLLAPPNQKCLASQLPHMQRLRRCRNIANAWSFRFFGCPDQAAIRESRQGLNAATLTQIPGSGVQGLCIENSSPTFCLPEHDSTDTPWQSVAQDREQLHALEASFIAWMTRTTRHVWRTNPTRQTHAPRCHRAGRRVDVMYRRLPQELIAQNSHH